MNRPRCAACGSVNTAQVRLRPCCYRVRRQPRNSFEVERDAARVDWAAVQCAAVERKPRPHLNNTERRLVVRWLSRYMPGRTDSHVNLPLGVLTAAQIGALIGLSERHTQRIKDDLPPASRRRCPSCRDSMWVLDATGVVEEHGDGFLERCSMSDRLYGVAVKLHPVPQAMLVLRCLAVAS